MNTFSRVTLVILLLIFANVYPQSAEKNPVDFIGANCDGTPPAKIWSNGGIVHVRGMTALHRIVSDNPKINGTDMMIINYDFNTKKRQGTLNGRVTLYPFASDGTWEAIFSGQFLEGRTYLKIVAHGTGELSGQNLKYDMVASIPAIDVPGLPYLEVCDGYPFDPPNVGFTAEGRILDPHSND